MLETPDDSTVLEKDYRVYVDAVRTGVGDRPDWLEEHLDEAFIQYVELAAPGKFDILVKEQTSQPPTPFHNEKHSRSGNRRRFTGEVGAAGA